MATTMANSAAVQNPCTSNLEPSSESVNKTINTVIIKETRPKVSQFNGKVNNLKIDPTVALTNPMTSPVTIAQPKPATSAPGTTQQAIATTRPVSKRLIINFIICANL